MSSIVQRIQSVLFGTLLALASVQAVVAADKIPLAGVCFTAFQLTSGPPVIGVIIEGAGIFSQLGRARCSSIDEVVDLTVDPPRLTGTMVLTAPNEDSLTGQMDAVVSLDFQNDVVDFEGTIPFTSGTGRFSGASGIVAFEGEAAPNAGPTGSGRFSIRGTISSPGANRK